MIGNFTFHNPTKLHFGTEALNNLGSELACYGGKVMLVYGGGSIKRNGIYDAVLEKLRQAGKDVVELGGVMPNPTIDKVLEGAALAKSEAVDLVLAIGGGLCGAGEFLFGPLQDKVTEKCFYSERGAVVPAVMGNDAGVVGAAMLRRDAEKH